MKVICIDDSYSKNGHTFPGFNWWIKEGETYTVERETIGYYTDGSSVPCYVLVEQPIMNGPCWEKSRFIPLSQIDETQMERNYSKQLTPPHHKIKGG